MFHRLQPPRFSRSPAPNLPGSYAQDSLATDTEAGMFPSSRLQAPGSEDLRLLDSHARGSEAPRLSCSALPDRYRDSQTPILQAHRVRLPGSHAHRLGLRILCSKVGELFYSSMLRNMSIMLLICYQLFSYFAHIKTT